MNKLLEKYNINIFEEKILSWEKKLLNIENLNDVVYKNGKIIINFNLIGKISSKDNIFYNKKGYFTERDVIEIIFSYYNGNLSENELTDIKNMYEIHENVKTRKDLLNLISNFHFNGFIKITNKYYMLLE